MSSLDHDSQPETYPLLTWHIYHLLSKIQTIRW